MRITVYQTDSEGLFLYSTEANELALDPGKYNIPFGAVLAQPPQASAGHVARWNGDRWDTVEDHRGDTLYVVSTGKQYTFGTAFELAGQDVRYAGWGEIPGWLTADAPEIEEPSEAGQTDDS